MSRPAPISPDDDTRWDRVVARNASADGEFWYSVTTTGIYCRPSCPSRTARREHVRFHASPGEARAAGARACRRCNPDGASVAQQNVALVEQACRRIEAAEAPPTLAELAAGVELSPAHFHRLFRAVTGVTPKAYAAACRARRTEQALARASSVTEAIHDAGASPSRFYAQARDRLGMAPRRYRAGGTAEVLRVAVGQCALGAILVASGARGIAAILLGDDPDALLRDVQDRFPHAELVANDTAHDAHVAQVIGLVEAPGSSETLPLDIRGTAFQQRVWQALRAIPPGTTASYAEVAAAIGAPAAVRAVAAACAANAHAVAIPCHRVVRSDGGLSGYRWGVERKRALIAREAGS